jgi:hypothetical protein
MANNWAIVVGINQYKFLPKAPLKFAVADALAMQSFLCQEAGFDPKHVFLCGDGGEEFSWEATRATLRDILLHTIQKARGADNLWFFFSGHGIDDHLMPIDGNSRDVKDTAISIHFVTDCLRQCKAKNVVMILDMCRNESRDVGRKNVPSIETGIRDLVRQREGQQGIITLFSCSHGESSYEMPDLQQGAFTYAFLEGLKSHSILKDLARHLEKRVPELHQLSGKNRKQVPLLIPEPDWKLNDPILSDYMTAVDVAQLKEMAIDAECDGELDRALQLWEQVTLLATKPDDRRRALNKVQSLMSHLSSVTKPIVSPTSEVPLSKGDLGGSDTEVEPIDTVPLRSARYINYQKLRDHLKLKEWYEANKETRRIMLKVAHQDNYLDRNSLEQFPSEDLQTLDRLWEIASDGKFGFRIQKKIWISCGKPSEYGSRHDSRWQEFGQSVGWRANNSWLRIESLTYDHDDAPYGHLPCGTDLVGCAYGVPWHTLLARRDL